jgi:hypothetical protein
MNKGILQGLGDRGMFADFDNVAKKLGEMRAYGIDISKELTQVGQVIGNNAKMQEVFNNKLKEATKAANEMKNRFDMSNLSMLFGGLVIQRMGMTLSRLLIPAMEKFGDMQHKGVKQVNAMRASFEFLKFSIFDTFSQTPIFEWFIKTVIQLSDMVAEFAQKHPIVTQAVAVMAVSPYF